MGSFDSLHFAPFHPFLGTLETLWRCEYDLVNASVSQREWIYIYILFLLSTSTENRWKLIIEFCTSACNERSLSWETIEAAIAKSRSQPFAFTWNVSASLLRLVVLSARAFSFLIKISWWRSALIDMGIVSWLNRRIWKDLAEEGYYESSRKDNCVTWSKTRGWTKLPQRAPCSTTANQLPSRTRRSCWRPRAPGTWRPYKICNLIHYCSVYQHLICSLCEVTVLIHRKLKLKQS